MGQEQNGSATAGEGPSFERWSAAGKSEVVLRLLRGEDVEAVSREVAMPVHQLEEWRRVFLDGGKTQLRTRGMPEEERELKHVQAKLGELVSRCGKTQLRTRGMPEEERELKHVQAKLGELVSGWSWPRACSKKGAGC